VATIRIRFNKDHKSDIDVWRVFEDGVEHIVTAFALLVPANSDVTFERGEMKWNVLCRGELTIRDGVAYVQRANEENLHAPATIPASTQTQATK
jgi:hypothetical protein